MTVSKEDNSQPPAVLAAIKNLKLPKKESHKGQNGKLIIIGGSELFHAASKWSLDIASKFIDMLFYSSIPSNNQLVKEAKQNFWSGIVVPRNELENYMAEADCVLIGPGMTRSEDTEKLVNKLLEKFPDKKWVIDAGALQMVDPNLLGNKMIITPHLKEMARVEAKLGGSRSELVRNGVVVIEKGEIDLVWADEIIGNKTEVKGGNAGMTKGGTGDVLAGLVAAFYCGHDAVTAAIAGSYFNKKAGDVLYEKVGPNFNASDLVDKVPEVVWAEVKKNTENIKTKA
jgi:hydroxyethylthiazole kinase-like uncharacterized protein yjeF